MIRKRQLLMFPVLLLLVAQGWATSFSISPILMEVPAPGDIATYRITNGASTPVTVQASAWQWQQQDGQDVYREATDVMIVPLLVEIAPGQSQAVRVASSSDRRGRELSYRIHFQEVPDSDQSQSTLLRTVLRMDVPLFFSTGKGKPALVWSLADTGQENQIVMGAINNGEKFKRLDAITLVDADGVTLASMRRPFYVLAGSNRIWVTDALRSLVTGEKIRLLLEQYGSVQEQLITVQ